MPKQGGGSRGARRRRGGEGERFCREDFFKTRSPVFQLTATGCYGGEQTNAPSLLGGRHDPFQLETGCEN